MRSVGWRLGWRIFVMVALVVAAVPVRAPTAAAQGPLTVILIEDPFVCDTVVRPLGTVSGLIAGEEVRFSSPQISTNFSIRTADAQGQVAMRWNCNAPKTWSVSVRGMTSGGSADFVVTGIAAPPPPQAPIGAAFDAKSAMTTAEMAIWKDFSPYNTAGVYIPVNSGWDNRADKIQRNLTASWVNEVFADGWRIIPIYVGRQAPRPCQTARFDGISTDPGIARNQGFEAANDAVASVSGLGMGPGSPIYYDMEAYRPGCADAVLAFLDAWTEGVHAAGYISGVYGSRSSTMWDLSRAFGRAGFDAPDAVWISTGNGRPVSLGLEVPSDGLWTNARIHQYRLNVTRTYGGVTLEVDENISNAPLASAAPAAPVAPTAVPQAIVDSDGDGFAEPQPDNCDTIANPDQADLDADGDGDVCDTDIDGDGVANDSDSAPRDPAVGAAIEPTAVPSPTEPPTPTQEPALAQPAEPAEDPLPTVVEANVIVLPTPAVVTPAPSTPPPTALPTPPPTVTPTDSSGVGGTDSDASIDASNELASDLVTITVEEENPLLPYTVGALAAFTLFCTGMGARSFMRNRQLAQAL